MKYAGFWKRVLAKLIDLVIFLPFIIINTYIFRQKNEGIFLAISLSITILILLYNVIFTYHLGKTPGKILLKLKVVKTDGKKVGVVNSISREVFAIISLMIWIVQEYKVFGDLKSIGTISFIFTLTGSFETLVCLFNYQCKTIHDFIGNTVVIKGS